MFTVFCPPHSSESSFGSGISSCHWLSIESSDWFSVCLAHHPVGFRTRMMIILCACARANVRAEVCFMGDNVCQCVLMYCIGDHDVYLCLCCCVLTYRQGWAVFLTCI